MPHACWLVRALVVLLLCGLVAPAGAERLSTSSVPAAAVDDDVQLAVGYRSGRRLQVKLVPVEWTYLDIATARDYRAMKAAALADGVELAIYSGFRSHERQIALYAAWKAGYGNRAARPGFSLHQSGRALDLYVGDEATREWLGRHAKKYGFRRTVGDEPWHFEHAPVRRRVQRKQR